MARQLAALEPSEDGDDPRAVPKETIMDEAELTPPLLGKPPPLLAPYVDQAPY